MRSIFTTFLLFSVLCISCTTSSPDNNENLPNVPVNITLSLNSPQYQNLLVPGGWVYVSGGIKGLIVYNFNGTEFSAFDRACPHLSVTEACSKMIVESGIKMICPCDDTEFSILDGSPLTTGVIFAARAYRATLVSSTTLTITNF